MSRPPASAALRGEAELRSAVTDMQSRLHKLRPDATLAGFTVQQMPSRPLAQELIVGASIDPVFGPVLLFGQGGTTIVVLADRAIALPPLNRVQARELISRTRVARLLAGYLDHLPAKLDAIGDVLIAVSQMMVDLPEPGMLGMNPHWEDREGAVAIDARLRLRLRLRRARPAGATNLAITPYPAGLIETLVWQGGEVVLRPCDCAASASVPTLRAPS